MAHARTALTVASACMRAHAHGCVRYAAQDLGRMSLTARTCVRLIVDRLECSRHAQLVHIQHNVSSAISLSAWYVVYDVWARRLASVQCMLKLLRSARPKYACAWTRRSIHSRLSPPAGPAPALYSCGRMTSQL